MKNQSGNTSMIMEFVRGSAQLVNQLKTTTLLLYQLVPLVAQLDIGSIMMVTVSRAAQRVTWWIRRQENVNLKTTF